MKAVSIVLIEIRAVAAVVWHLTNISNSFIVGHSSSETCFVYSQGQSPIFGLELLLLCILRDMTGFYISFQSRPSPFSFALYIHAYVHGGNITLGRRRRRRRRRIMYVTLNKMGEREVRHSSYYYTCY